MIRAAVARAAIAAVATCAMAATPSATAATSAPGGATAAPDDRPPQVFLVTIGPGELTMEKWGHAAICLRPWIGEAECFNYGVTDFDAGSILIWRFLRADQQFWVESERYEHMIRSYELEDRDIFVQTLPVTPARALSLERKLHTDLEPAHRAYVYDHFFDNCATRVRDLIDVATDGALRASSDGASPLTFRELGRLGLAEHPGMFAVTDFVLGRKLDDTPSLWQAMFYPPVLRARVEVALGASPQPIYRRHGRAFPSEGPSGRGWMLAIGLMFAAPLLVATWRRRFVRLATAWATLWLAGWGIAVWTLVAISSIPGLRWNEVALVMVPVDVILPLLGEPRRRRYARGRVVGLLLVSALGALGVLHQPLWVPLMTAIVPLATIAVDR